MGKKGGRRIRSNETGFTLVEMIIYFAIAVTVIAGVYQVLMGQSRLYVKQRELQDVRTNLRAVANLLAYEFRHASSTGGDLYSVAADSFSVRSVVATGIVCGLHNNHPRAGLWGVEGELTATLEDSALVYGAVGTDWWISGSIDHIWEPNVGGVDWCDWGSGNETPPDVVVNVTGGPGQPPDSSSGEITISAHSAVNDGNTVTFTASHPDLECWEFDNRAQLIIDADKDGYNGGMSGCTFSHDIRNGAKYMDIEIQISAASSPFPAAT